MGTPWALPWGHWYLLSLGRGGHHGHSDTLDIAMGAPWVWGHPGHGDTMDTAMGAPWVWGHPRHGDTMDTAMGAPWAR